MKWGVLTSVQGLVGPCLSTSRRSWLTLITNITFRRAGLVWLGMEMHLYMW